MNVKQPTSENSTHIPSAQAASTERLRRCCNSMCNPALASGLGTKCLDAGSTLATSAAPRMLGTASTRKACRQGIHSLRWPSKKRPRNPPNTVPAT